MARAYELLRPRVEEHRTRKVRAALIEGDELVFGEAKENARIVFRWISEELVATDGNLMNVCNSNG